MAGGNRSSVGSFGSAVSSHREPICDMADNGHYLATESSRPNNNRLELRQVMNDNEPNYVAGLAMRWARTDPMEQWVNAAPQGRANTA
jgi:hypothetical protein